MEPPEFVKYALCIPEWFTQGFWANGQSHQKKTDGWIARDRHGEWIIQKQLQSSTKYRHREKAETVGLFVVTKKSYLIGRLTIVPVGRFGTRWQRIKEEDVRRESHRPVK